MSINSSVTARPSPALRQRRESARPSLARTSTTKGATTENESIGKEERPYSKNYDHRNNFVLTPSPVTRQEDILRKFNDRPPSLRVYLHLNHFRLGDSQESFSYASPMKELLQHIRAKTVPHNMVDEFYAWGVPFYDSKAFWSVFRSVVGS